MAKHIWQENEVITAALLNDMEDRIEAKAQKGEKGDQGPQGQPGAPGKDAVINKLNKADSLTVESATAQQIATAFNNLIADLKSKGYMNQT